MNNASKIDKRRKQAIPDEIAYQSKMAEPSELEFRQVIDPALVSRKGKHKAGINRTQAYKVKRAFEKYQRNWDRQFAEDAKLFKEKVRSAQDTFAKGASEIPLALTGIKSLESGPVRIAVFWLSGDSRARGLLRPADRTVEPSEPFNITTPEQRNSLRALLLARLVQSGAAILHAQLDPAVVTEMNTVDNHLAQSMVDPGLGLMPFATEALSHLDYIVENGQLFLSVKVSQV